MSDFARQQAEFQRGILDGDDTVLSELLDSPREKREVLFGVYRYAYGSRLLEAMRNDHELLHLYLGDEMFDEMGHAYVKARPSGHPNLRWFSQGLPAFLESTAPYAEHPELSDLAALEKALNDAFDGAEGKVVELADMAGFAPEAWSGLRFRPHPSAGRLDHSTNAAAIWLVLQRGRVGETYNIGGLNEKPNIEIVQTICALLDNKSPRANGASYAAQITYVTDRPGHDRRYAIDCSKIQQELGWAPRENFSSGISKTVDWYLNHRQWAADITTGRSARERLGVSA